MESLLKIISFVILLTGLFKIFDISIFDLTDDIAKFLSKEKTDIKSKIRKQAKKKKQKGIRKIIDETISILNIIGKLICSSFNQL